MPSALIRSRPGYPAVPRAGQPAHQRSVLPNPLVLGETLRKFPPPTADRDRPVSRRSKPSSRTAFIGEQPNPWDLLQPQDAMSRHRTFFHTFMWRRLYLHLVSGVSALAPGLELEMTRVGVLPRMGIRSLPFRVSRYRVQLSTDC